MMCLTCAGSSPNAVSPGSSLRIRLVRGQRVDEDQDPRTCGSRRPWCRCSRSQTRRRRSAWARFGGSSGRLGRAPRRRSGTPRPMSCPAVFFAFSTQRRHRGRIRLGRGGRLGRCGGLRQPGETPNATQGTNQRYASHGPSRPARLRRQTVLATQYTGSRNGGLLDALRNPNVACRAEASLSQGIQPAGGGQKILGPARRSQNPAPMTT
jgi:hypothetical protein